MYHFISGYTAKVAGTEVGVTEPSATFSACFGQAFLPLHPFKYAEMLAEFTELYGAKVWMINTGWTGGRYGVGKRMSLKYTRQILDCIHDGSLDKSEYQTLPVFNLSVPKTANGIPSEILNPRETWADKSGYDEIIKKLAGKFTANMKKFEDLVP